MEKSSVNRELALKISGVTKKYRLGQIGGGTLQADIQSWWARKRGKEDPNSLVGTEQRLIGQTFMALNGVDLEIYKGEAVGIIGGNGAGKSTLLKLLSQVTAPTTGTIDLFGRVASMLEVGTGFNGEMTGRENIYMNGAILGMSHAEIDAKMEDIIDFSEVRDFIDTPVKRYSSGMYVKLAFSVAAHLDSEIMIMDEVLAVGDMAFQKKCLDKMRTVAKKEGRTVLYVSHNMNTIRQLCDRCIVLDKGRVMYDGQVETAIDFYLGSTRNTIGEIDLSNGHRNQPMIEGVKIENIKILDRTDWEIEQGEKLRFEIKVRATKDLENVGYRSRLFSESGLSVSVLYAHNLFSCKAGEVICISLEADLHELTPGYYKLTPVLYGANEYGGWNFYDHVEDAVSLIVKSTLNFNHNIPWEERWAGCIKLPEMSLLDQHIVEC